MPASMSGVRATVANRPADVRFWISAVSPSWAGSTMPENRTLLPRLGVVPATRKPTSDFPAAPDAMSESHTALMRRRRSHRIWHIDV